MDIDTWFWIGTLGMIIGAAVILIMGKQRTLSEQTHTIISGIVPVIAACVYFAMANGQGVIELQTSLVGSAPKTIWYARYIDWLFTTPLLLTGLGLSAMHGLSKRWGVIFGLIASDVIMIATAIMFAVTPDAWTRWMWFLISCAAFLAVYYGIWVQLKTINKAATPDAQAAFKSSAVLLSILWFIYPVVLAIGIDGTAVLSPMLTVAIITVLDLAAKVGYGLKSTTDLGKITSRDLTENRMEKSF